MTAVLPVGGIVGEGENASVPALEQSQTTETKAKYEARIDELFCGERPRYKQTVMLDRSDLLDLMGLGAKPVRVVESKIVSDKHALTTVQWKQMPSWMEDPAAVFRSQTNPDRLVIFAPEVLEGRPIRIIVEPNAGASVNNVHLVINAYDESGVHITPVDKWVKAGDLLYFDQKKCHALSERSGLRLPSEVRQLRGYTHKVLTDADLVKYRESILKKREITVQQHD